MEEKHGLPFPSENFLAERERKWRVVFPKDYKEFVRKYNGMVPEKCYFNFHENEKVIERFLAILDISVDRMENVYDIGVVSTQLEGRIVFDEDFVGLQLIPIAALFGGDFVCLDYSNGIPYPTVCLWINEESDELAPVTEFISETFTEFLSLLHD